MKSYHIFLLKPLQRTFRLSASMKFLPFWGDSFGLLGSGSTNLYPIRIPNCLPLSITLKTHPFGATGILPVLIILLFYQLPVSANNSCCTHTTWTATVGASPSHWPADCGAAPSHWSAGGGAPSYWSAGADAARTDLAGASKLGAAQPAGRYR
jgi:hypothetical protein